MSSEQVSTFLSGWLSGLHVSTYREGNELIEVLLRGSDQERAHMEFLGSVTVPTASGKSVPLSQIATLEYVFEDGIIWHRDRLPTVTVRADIRDATQPATVAAQIAHDPGAADRALGLSDVTLFPLVFRVAFGFIAMLDTIALAGVIMRNALTLLVLPALYAAWFKLRRGQATPA